MGLHHCGGRLKPGDSADQEHRLLESERPIRMGFIVYYKQRGSHWSGFGEHHLAADYYRLAAALHRSPPRKKADRFTGRPE